MGRSVGARSSFLIGLGATLALAAPACAEERRRITLDAGRLSVALQTLSARNGVNLLFAPEVVGARRGPRVVGTMTIEEALGRLLAGSGLTFRRTASGAFVIENGPAPETVWAAPEILVVGRKTQNVDIRRTKNDIQPYQVTTARDVASSMADNVGQALRKRLTGDATLQTASNDPSSAGAMGGDRSEVSLHGLGADYTLVLVDGARMPGVPNIADVSRLALQQPDLNGLPLFLIDRVETLTSTAGGIYGPGAMAGVVNVVLRRDYRGAEAHAVYGLSKGGKAPERRFEGRIGFTPNGGRTDVMLAVSRSASDALRAGDRDYAAKARRRLFERASLNTRQNFNTIDGVVVTSLAGQGKLSLKPQFGGATLGSNFTYLPLGEVGAAGGLGAALASHAGQIPDTLSNDGYGARRSLTNDSDVTAVVLSARQRVGDRVEAFLDLIGSRSEGYAETGDWLDALSVITRSAPTNPFQQDLIVTTPLPGFGSKARNRLRTYRATAGAIIQLPRAWKVEARYAVGSVRSQIDVETATPNDSFLTAISSGVARRGRPLLDPFGDWDAFATALQAYKDTAEIHFPRRSAFRDASLRLAGPVLTTAAGPVFLTLLAEQRREEAPKTSYVTIAPFNDAVEVLPNFTQTVTSFYGELRAPLVPRESGARPLRGLTLQLAARHDRNGSALPSIDDPYYTATQYSAHQGATAYTLGFRAFPLDRLMVRASASTGVLPPTAEQLLQTSSLNPLNRIGDPKRGNRTVGSEGNFRIIEGGSSSLKPARALTLSVGLVLNPEGNDLPRVSLDYRRIDIRDEIVASPGSYYFLVNEDRFPDRVRRAPLTAADIAAGFSSGVILSIDATAVNAGGKVIDSLELNADHALDLGSAGLLRLHGALTYMPRFKLLPALNQRGADLVGVETGPDKWRGGAGLDWERGPFSLAANGQVYGSYSVSVPGFPRERARVPTQAYVDLSAAYEIDLPGGPARQVEIRLGVANILDKAPPIVTNAVLGYSYYGDPRQRRVELMLSARF